jgi:hypothetical protein
MKDLRVKSVNKDCFPMSEKEFKRITNNIIKISNNTINAAKKKIVEQCDELKLKDKAIELIVNDIKEDSNIFLNGETTPNIIRHYLTEAKETEINDPLYKRRI